MSNDEKIVILDLGNKNNQLLARKIREQHVYSELYPNTVTIEEIKALDPKGIILMGTDEDIQAEDSAMVAEEVFELGVPVLAIGSGMLQMALHFGGKVVASEQAAEVGNIEVQSNSVLFDGIPQNQSVFLNQGNQAVESPAAFQVDAINGTGQAVAISNTAKQMFGIQFQLEEEATEHGIAILKQFLFTVCQCSGGWTMDRIIEEQVQKIRDQVGDQKVICALSGGVDSSVVAVLIHKAIGDQLTCIFVDHGLLRKNEANEVMHVFTEDFKMNVIKVDAQERFLSKLKGEDDPEKKRKIIGNEFIYVFDDEAAKLKDTKFLAQGTIYSDIVESGGKAGKLVKSHHNVGGLPEDMEFELIEPLSLLFKDEVRELGTALGIPDYIIWRQPFPGPGLGVRVLGEITEEKLHIVREADAVVREEIAAAGLDRDIWQYFAVLPNIRSVGVKGNARSYDYTVGVRAIHSVDAMTAEFAEIPWKVLSKISSRIVTEVDHVNRVVYDITGKPPATIEWE